MDSPKYIKTKQRLEVIKTLQDNLSRGQLWAAFYDKQFRVAKGLVKLGVIEYEELSGVFAFPGKLQPEAPDCPWRKYYE